VFVIHLIQLADARPKEALSWLPTGGPATEGLRRQGWCSGVPPDDTLLQEANSTKQPRRNKKEENVAGHGTEWYACPGSGQFAGETVGLKSPLAFETPGALTLKG